MNDIITLIKETFTTDAIGQRVATETRRTIFADIGSVSMQEWYEAGRNGLRPQLRALIPRSEYAGEELVEYKGVKYSVYRTYFTANETVELYLERKAGV